MKEQTAFVWDIEILALGELGLLLANLNQPISELISSETGLFLEHVRLKSESKQALFSNNLG